MKTEFVWWRGRVEDVNDPLEIGRCRVRILGYHTDDKSAIPTNSLPWAYPANPINSRPGETALGPVEGSWVMGFFQDGEDAQEPIMTHSIDLGYKNEDDSSNQKVDVDEINSHRLSRGNTSGSYVANTSLPFADKSSLSHGAKFPYNQVVESLSGHVTEVDDTPGAERLATHHKSGTVEVIEADGTKVVKVVGDNYEVVVGNNNVDISGTVTVNVAGSANITTGGSANITSTGNLNLESSMFITMKSLLGVVVEAPFLGTTSTLGGAILHGALSPMVVPGPAPPVATIKSIDSIGAGNILDKVKSDLEKPNSEAKVTNLGGTSITDIIK